MVWNAAIANWKRRRDGKLPQIAAQQQRATPDARRQPAQPRRRPREHRRRAVDADDDVARAQQRHHQPSRAAAEVEDRAAALVGQRAVEADVVAAPPVFPVVEHGVFEGITRRHRPG